MQFYEALPRITRFLPLNGFSVNRAHRPFQSGGACNFSALNQFPRLERMAHANGLAPIKRFRDHKSLRFHLTSIAPVHTTRQSCQRNPAIRITNAQGYKPRPGCLFSKGAHRRKPAPGIEMYLLACYSARMSRPFDSPVAVVTAPAYQLIAQSPRLAKTLAPDGVDFSPYEILDYDATLTLHDPRGQKSTFAKKQLVRFLQNRVGGILDHVWGWGDQVGAYQSSAGPLTEEIADQGVRHLVISLNHPMAAGDPLMFQVTREARNAFTASTGLVETCVDHPIWQLKRTVIFPKERPCQSAKLVVAPFELELPIYELADGRTMVRVDIPNPTANTPIQIHWTW
jgi:hypothetical protein